MIYAQEIESGKMLLFKDDPESGKAADVESNCQEQDAKRGYIAKKSLGFLVWPVINLMLFGIFGY